MSKAVDEKAPLKSRVTIFTALATVLLALTMVVASTAFAESSVVKSSGKPGTNEPTSRLSVQEVEAADFGTEEDCVRSDAYCIPSGLASVYFTSTGSGCTWNVTVDWGDGSTTPVTYRSSTQVSHQYTEPGVYTVRWTGSGTPDDSNVTCTFNPGSYLAEVPTSNEPPVADFTWKVAKKDNTGLKVVFDASSSKDPDAEPGELTYSWTFEQGPFATGPTPTHTFPKTGTYTVKLHVADAQGASDSVTKQVQVELKKPFRGYVCVQDKVWGLVGCRSVVQVSPLTKDDLNGMKLNKFLREEPEKLCQIAPEHPVAAFLCTIHTVIDSADALTPVTLHPAFEFTEEEWKFCTSDKVGPGLYSKKLPKGCLIEV